MKKKWNKLVALTVALCLMAVAITGCGSGTATKETEETTEAEETTQAAEETTQAAEETTGDLDNGGDKTIGVVFYSKTDALGSVVYALINEAAKTWGVNIKWEIGGLDNDTQLNSVQNLISGGVDGIVIIPLADTVTQKTSEMCEKAGVYFSLCFRDIIDDDIREQVAANPYFVGMSFEADYDAAKEMVKIAAEIPASNEPNAGMLAFLHLANAARVKYPAACCWVFDLPVEEGNVIQLFLGATTFCVGRCSLCLYIIISDIHFQRLIYL